MLSGISSPEALLEALDPEQREVAQALRGPVAVIAGAGTGKTRAITHRIAYGVATGVYRPHEVLAVTFTTRAAGEMRGRLSQLGAPGVQARTFHSAALRQLRYFWPQYYGGEFPDIISLCAKYGNADMVYEFASTSKVTFPGAGVGVMASSADNIAYFSKLINIQTIGFDKINQLRHVLFLKDKAHTLALMKQHAAILAPKFHAVLDALDKEIAPLGIAGYKRPVGGYFVSVDVMPGCAKRTLALCKEAGVTMTGAGATFPYGKDPQDSNIRIAPSLPPVAELEQAIAVFCTCLKLAALEKLGI